MQILSSETVRYRARATKDCFQSLQKIVYIKSHRYCKLLYSIKRSYINLKNQV